MSESSSRPVARMVWTTLRAAVYVAIAGLVLFFALTRTDVGRNRLRQELQSAVDTRVEGRLRIDSLQGTLLRDVQATNVQLQDENGKPVLTIDSVAATPSWASLLTGELPITSLTLVRPHLTLHRRTDTTWNLQNALRRRVPSASSRPIDLSFANVEVQDGRITTTRSGAAPSSVQDRWLFDYTRSELHNIDLNASLQWSRAERRISLHDLHMGLPDKDLTLKSAQVDVSKEENRWTLNPLSLQLGNTQLDAEGTMHPSPQDPDELTATLTLEESRLDHDQLRRLVPRLPLRKEMTIEGKIGGSLDRLVVNELTVRHRRSYATLEGTAFGLPDSLDLDAQMLRSSLRPSDLRSVWPEAPLNRIRSIGSVRLGAELRGTVAWRNRPQPRFDLTSTLTAEGTPGAVRGSLRVQRSNTSPLTYDGTLQVDSLNLAPLTDSDRLDSRLTGRVTFDGTGTTPTTLRGALSASLSDSRMGTRRLAAADLALTVDRGNGQGNLHVQQPNGGTLTIEGSVNDTGPIPHYDGVATAKQFNLAGADRSLPSSRLNATLTAEGRGATWRTLTGTLALSVDSSELRPGPDSSILPPHKTTLTLAPRDSSTTRLRVDGPIASATLDGPLFSPTARQSGQLWFTALQHLVQEKVAAAQRTSPTTAPTPRTPILGNLNDTSPSAPLSFQGELSIHRMDLLHKWWPDAPAHSGDVHASTALTISPDTLSVSGQLRAPRLVMGSRRVDSLTAQYDLHGPLQPDLGKALSASLDLRADTLHLDSRPLIQPALALTLTKGAGALQASMQSIGRTGPFRLASTLQIRDGLHVRIQDLYAGMGQDAWTTERPATVTLHTNAISTDSLALESPRSHADAEQKLLLRGTISTVPSDTLHAEMSEVLLYPISELLSLNRPIGGKLDGEVSLTGGWVQPQLRSNFTVQRLSFDQRILGTLRGKTRLTSDSPDLILEAALEPGASSLEALDGPPLTPNGPETIEENALQVQGRIRLPGWADLSSPPTTDQLDLGVNVDRADLFFFKYIFDETLAKVQGYTAGAIHISGHFLDPVFDAEMSIQNAKFSLPRFGLSYRASGSVNVDKKGIHVQELAVSDKKGTGTVRGSLLFNDYQFFSFDLSATLDELSIISVEESEELPFYGQIRASGPVSLTGPLPNATLRSEGARTTPDSELFIPVTEAGVDDGSGFFVFADSTGTLPDLRELTRRDNILADRPEGESSFLDGLAIDINVLAPAGSTVHLVFDPVVGDVVTAVGSGRVQLQREEGEFRVFGNYEVTGGTYLFTAGEVFVRRFNINEGTITWDGPPTNAQLDLKADYRTRASPAGLPGYSDNSGRIPVRVLLDIGGRVATPQVNLSLSRIRDERDNLVGSRTLDAILNQSDRTTEYATSVLLTNTFLLTTESFTGGQSTDTEDSSSGNLRTAGNQLAFNSVSQLVASQLNRYLGAALPNVDLNFGVQGENPNDLDLIYGVALRLLNERLVIRGEGVYTGDDPDRRQAEGPQGEFVVEVRLSSRVSAEVFHRRTGDELTRGETLTSSTGAGLSYQTNFPNWRTLFRRIFGWLLPDDNESEEEAPTPDPPSDSPSPDEDAPNEPVVRRSE